MGPKSKTSLMGIGVTLLSVGSSLPYNTTNEAITKAVTMIAGVVLIYIKYKATSEGINLEGGIEEDDNKGTD